LKVYQRICLIAAGFPTPSVKSLKLKRIYVGTEAGKEKEKVYLPLGVVPGTREL
jgi:hypothetical protein